MEVAARHNLDNSQGDQITLPWMADADLVRRTVAGLFQES
jgi:hypothetical protein